MRRSLTAGALTAAAIILAAAVLGVAGAVAGTGGSDSASRASSPYYPADYRRVLQIVSDLHADPPADPLVVLLGGSSARESTISDDSWSQAVSALRGFGVDCVNLGSKHRLFTQDRRIAAYLPESTNIVFIGVNMGRFCNGPADPTVPFPQPVAAAGRGVAAGPRKNIAVWSDARRRQVARQWMVRRWPSFEARWRSNMTVLRSICVDCLARGQHPVIIDLPRNMQIIRHQLDEPLHLYHRGCRRIATSLGIPYVQFQSSTGLTDQDFADLWHTVASGKAKWQQVLAITTERLLVRYGIQPAPSPSPTPTPSPSPTATSSPSPSVEPSPSGSGAATAF